MYKIYTTKNKGMIIIIRIKLEIKGETDRLIHRETSDW